MFNRTYKIRFYEEINPESTRIIVVARSDTIKRHTITVYNNGVKVSNKPYLEIGTDFEITKKKLRTGTFSLPAWTHTQNFYNVSELVNLIKDTLIEEGFDGVSNADSDIGIMMLHLDEKIELQGRLAVMKSEGYLNRMNPANITHLTSFGLAGLFFDHYQRLNSGYVLDEKTGVYLNPPKMRIV